MLNGIQKFFAVSWLGRDSFRALLAFRFRCAAWRIEHGTDKIIAQKLAASRGCTFARQRLAAVGPRLPARQDLFQQAAGVRRPLPVRWKTKHAARKFPTRRPSRNAIALMEEIAANFSTR